MVAQNTFAAIKARALLDIEWDDGPNAGYDSTAFRETLAMVPDALDAAAG